MLLKFAAADMLNSALIDVSTGEHAYNIVTVLLPPISEAEKDETSNYTTLSQDHGSEEQRHTCITDSSGTTLVSISWNGRRPNIDILNEKVGGLTDLFGSSTVRFMPKILAVPTRFDTEYVWTATPNSLTLFDYDSETTKGTFYQSAIRLSKPFKSKLRLSSTPSLDAAPNSVTTPSSSLSSSSSDSLHSSTSFAPTSNASSLCTSSSSHPQPILTDSPKSSFISTHLPGVGSNYLEFRHHPLAHDVEIIVSFLMMEILRRGRFVLTPYTFQKPKMWQLKESRDLILRRLRRNTV